MGPRKFRLMAALGALALTCACASSGDNETIARAAQTACEARHLPPGSAMNACLDEVEESIRAARDYEPEPERPPPRPPQRPRN